MKCANSFGRSQAPRVLWTALVLLAMLLITAAAATAAPTEPAGPDSPVWLPHADDANAREVGAEGAGGAEQAYADSEVHALTNRLASCGWLSRYHWSGANAWEEDFKRPDWGGTEPNWLDTVDLGFYVGHGGPGSFNFDVWHDDPWLTPNDCYQTWGRYDNEWVALTSCSVFSGAHPNPWANCMYGNHVILGFKTGAAVRWGTGTQGYQFANHLCYGWTVTGAWFRACDITNPAGAVVRAMAEEAPCFNDVPGVWDCGPESNFSWNTYWSIDHVCGSPTPRPVNLQAIAQMPVFQTEPLTLDQAVALSGDLGNTFQLTSPAAMASGTQATCNQADPWVSKSADGKQQLEMDCYSGQFSYVDQNMWNGAAVQQAIAAASAKTPARLLTPQDAHQIAEDFLLANGLKPGDAKYFGTEQDMAATGAKPGVTGASAMAPVEGPLVYQVIYERTITATVSSALGPAAVEEFQVFGPGGKLIVSVPVQQPVGQKAAALPVSGTLGGWPKLMKDNPAAKSATAVQQVPVLDYAQIEKLHTPELEGFVVLNITPIAATQHLVISHTLGYWSEGLSQPQPELIPSYVLSTDFYSDTTKLMHGWEYIPANPTYMRPYAKITTIPTGVVEAGQMIQLEAADASKTLAELGYDQSLNFMLGVGLGPEKEFAYDWYEDSVSGKHIGSGRSISYKVEVGPDVKDTFERTIVLQVTDLGSSAQTATTDSGSLKIDTKKVKLPVVLR